MSRTRPPNENDPRVRRTRRALTQALEALMAEKSFAAISVQDVARRADVNRATFYAHFRDKDELVEYALRASFRERLRAGLPRGTPFTAENLGRLIRIVCDFLAEVGGHCPPPRARFEPLMERQVKAELVEVLMEWMATDHTTRSASAPSLDLAAKVASWAIYGAAVQWVQQTPPLSWKRFIQQVLPMILAGLPVNEPGRAA